MIPGPDAAAARWQRVAAVFDRVVDCGEAERDALLAAECGDDPGLRAEVEALLAADRAATAEWIEREMAAAAVAKGATGHDHSAMVGRVIDGFRITAVLGSGGMGTVFAAEQERPRRTVALKTMRLGLLSPSARRRFEYEAELLGRLRHPGIAQVHAAGTWREPVSGVELPYFALEMVEDAVPLDRFVREHRLSLAAAIDLFLQVCDAVHHGHLRGIVHRDLKPGNLVVDGHGRVKVIDFGIARAVEGEIEATRLTDAGQVLGTLQYMAPEQLTGAVADVDQRVDVYALGAVLYELLTGSPPVDARAGSLATAIQRIQQSEPPAPSSIPSPLASRPLPREFDWITSRALAKEPDERYGSVDELAADLRHLLADEPVTVGPPSTGYRVRKFVRRHRVMVGAAAGVLCALVLGVIGTTWQLLRANAARDDALVQTGLADAARTAAERETERANAARTEAERQAARVTGVNEFYNVLLGFGDPFERRQAGTGPDISMREAMAGAAALLDQGRLSWVTAEPEIEADVRLTLGNAYRAWKELDAARQQLVRALELRRAALGAEHVDVAEAHNALGVLAAAGGSIAVAREHYQQAIAIHRGQRVIDQKAFATALLNLAVVTSAESPEQATELLTEAIERFGRVPDAGGQQATAMAHLARLRQQLGDHDGAIAMLRRSLETFAAAGKSWHPFASMTRTGLANLLLARSRNAEAEGVLREAWTGLGRSLGPDDPQTLMAGYGLGIALSRLRRFDESIALLDDVLARRVAAAGPVDANTIKTRFALAETHAAAGDGADAEREYLAIFEAIEANPAGSAQSMRRAAEQLQRVWRDSGRDQAAAALQARLEARLGKDE